VQLEAEWDFVINEGFFSKLRFGIFDEQAFTRVQRILNAVELPQGEMIDKRFIEVTWFMPTYMRWQ
jgi:hypothetical protein